MSNRVTWQGSFDMLCGVYCAAHLIASFAVKEKATRKNQSDIYENAVEEAFGKLVRSMEQVGLLRADKIVAGKGCAGLTDRQIESIFNNLSEKSRAGLKAVAFSRPKIKAMRNSERRHVLESGARAIVQEHGGDHWITVEGRHEDGGYRTFDPQLTDNTKHRTKLGWEKGVFIGKAGLWPI